MKIAVFGTGYVGLVAGVCFADAGHNVTCVDIDAEKIARLRDGVVPIYEPGLDELLKGTLKARRIHFTTDGVEAVKQNRVIFLAVGTPENADGTADLKYVMEVIKTIGTQMTDEKTVVMKSTVPVGTAEIVHQTLSKLTKLPFEIVSNPEFLKEGTSVDDFLRPDRVVIGCRTEKAQQIMSELYSPFVRNGKPILFMSNKAAEMTKYAANAFLATKISFINELALLCDAVGCDVDQVRKGFTSDSRINPAFFYPGVGYGGSCFPKDVKALVKTASQLGITLNLVEATEKANEFQKLEIVKKAKKHFGKLQGLKIGIWGLAFKPRTDDVREAPSFSVITGLLKEGASVKVYDPVAIPNTRKVFGDQIEYCQDSQSVLNGIDALMLVTEWNEFKSPDLEVMAKSMKQKVIFDGRNLFDPSIIKKAGFKYFSIGREAVT